MDLTNEELQNEFEKYLEGEKIEWYLARVFYDQHGGFARRTADKERAIGILPKEKAIVISYIHITEDDDGNMLAREEDGIQLSVGREEYEKLKYMAEYSFNKEPDMSLKDPNNHDDMIG